MNRRKVLKALLGIPFIAKLFSLPVDVSNPVIVALPNPHLKQLQLRWLVTVKYKDGIIETFESNKFDTANLVGRDVDLVTGHTIYECW